MNVLYKILFVFLLLSLHACALDKPLSQSDQDITNEEIRAVQKQLQEQPNDIVLNRKLIEAYLDKFNKNKSRKLALLLIEQAEKYLVLNSDDEPVKLVLYEFLARDALFKHSGKNLPRLSTIFNNSALIKQTTYAPPSAIEAYILLDRGLNKGNIPLVKKKLHDAIKENPNYTKSYRMLSSIYRLENRFNLAIAILRQSEKINANDPALYKTIGDLYINKARAKTSCFVADEANLKKALQAYRQAVKLSPDDTETHENLAELYHWTRKIPLYLHEAKRLYELDQKSLSGRHYYAESLFWRNPATAYLQISKLLQDDPNDPLTLSLQTRYYFMSGQWQQALKVSETQRSSAREYEFYRLLREYLILRKLGKADAARAFFTDKTAQIDLKDWELQLKKYYLGEITEQGLLSKSADVCEITEAYFYIGFDHWLKGNTGQARDYFNKTLSQGHPAYIEHNAAKNLLPLLDSTDYSSRN